MTEFGGAPKTWLADEPRRAGILLHPTSLPGPGIGDLGPAAHEWIDWLASAGQTVWQILPLVPVNDGGSPYNGLSALAGCELLVSPTRLVEEKLLPEGADIDPGFDGNGVDYPEVARWKDELFQRAHRTFRDTGTSEFSDRFHRFRRENASWLDDYCLFRLLRERYESAAWTDWDPEERDRDPGRLERLRTQEADALEERAFRQFLFDRQWESVRAHARRRGILVFGDVPIFVSHDSADVWSHRELFRLDGEGRPSVVAGVPPDAFSATGQRWGNPIPRWEVMREKGFPWWTQRLGQIQHQVDIARIDHFRGFEAFWEIPADEETAVNGRWKPGPGRELFDVVSREVGEMRLVAEDLGLITDEVYALRDSLGMPGMRVLQFAFDGDPENPYLPANYPEDTVAYTGTHDNDTVVGWYREGADEETRRRVDRLVDAGVEDLHWRLIRPVWRSRARMTVAPVQDVLGLGNEARMNMPGSSDGNWAWRLEAGALTSEVAERLREETASADRLGAPVASV